MDDQDVLDHFYRGEMAQVTDARWWKWLALGALATALLCGTLAVIGWVLRPDVQTVVKLVHVTEAGVAEDRGTVAMAQYTPAEWQWIALLRQWVLALRWQGLDVRQTQLAWEWLKWHTCGEAVEALQRYYTVMEPFEHVGTRKREVLNIMVTKGDIDGLWTVLWKEITVQGSQQAVESQQSVSFAVARRTVTKEMARSQINPFGLCVKQVGGLTL